MRGILLPALRREMDAIVAELAHDPFSFPAFQLPYNAKSTRLANAKWIEKKGSRSPWAFMVNLTLLALRHFADDGPSRTAQHPWQTLESKIRLVDFQSLPFGERAAYPSASVFGERRTTMTPNSIQGGAGNGRAVGKL